MRTVSIIADSTCDLSEELLDKYKVTIFPLHIHLGDKEYLDGVDIVPEEIYRWSDENKVTPKTSSISPEDVKKYLRKSLAGAKEVICFCISSEMSSCSSVVELAAIELGLEKQIFVIDSKNLSTGIGLQIIEASLMAEQGMKASEIVKKIGEIQPYIRASFVVDTLTYLHRGGRCSGVAAFAGSALKLHPYIEVVDGKMLSGKKYRGKMQNVLYNYVTDLKQELEKARCERVFITHSGCDNEIISQIKQQLQQMNYFDEIYITRAGGVISSHCGPGTLGVLFIAGN